MNSYDNFCFIYKNIRITFRTETTLNWMSFRFTATVCIMLKNLDPLLGPELLKILRAMGHGDEIAIVDANHPAETNAQRLIRMDGISATRVLEAMISVMPLDTYVECPVHTMQVVGDPEAAPEIVKEFRRIVRSGSDTEITFGTLERFDFYARVNLAFAVIATGEQRLYGNIILKKGVIDTPNQE